MITIADYSEFQGDIHPPANQIVIIRADNGWRADNDFTVNRANAHAAGCPAVGLYQYLPATVDPAGAAQELLQLVGQLAANEWLICDLEEGAGDQQPRWIAWRNTVLAGTNRGPWLYSGLAFAAAHDLHPDWLAAYQPSEPSTPHKLWQNTDAHPWPWGKADGSVFDGTLPQFLAAIGINLPGPVIQGADMYPSGKLAAPILCAYDRPNHPGQGWRFAADGGVFPYGGAPVYGNPSGAHLAAPIVAAAVAEDGYTMIGSDGGSFPYGPGAPKVDSLA